ncbi:MAG: hypothetical protein ABSH39_14515 [Candidatus Acidiferrum sp.]|jgi:hypothetical protein
MLPVSESKVSPRISGDQYEFRATAKDFVMNFLLLAGIMSLGESFQSVRNAELLAIPMVVSIIMTILVAKKRISRRE